MKLLKLAGVVAFGIGVSMGWITAGTLVGLGLALAVGAAFYVTGRDILKGG